MESLFEGLTESEIHYLQYLDEHGYYDGFEMFLNEDTSSDYRVDKLYKNGYITLDDPGPYPGSQSVTLTGKGIAAIIDYERYQDQKQAITPKDDALNRIANSLAMLTNVSIRQADSVNTITQEAKKQANITNDAKIILYKLYVEYRKRRKHGFSKPFSKNFGTFDDIHSNFFYDQLAENLNDFLNELIENGFLNDVCANDGIQKYELSNYAISTLEALPVKAFQSTKKFITDFFPFPISK